jgi:t-SNARE complex subunit (syntaxin)
MQTLYSYISAREREEIAEAPIEQAMKNYRETRLILLVVYALLVVALIVAGVHTIDQVASTDAGTSTNNPAALEKQQPPQPK